MREMLRYLVRFLLSSLLCMGMITQVSQYFGAILEYDALCTHGSASELLYSTF